MTPMKTLIRLSLRGAQRRSNLLALAVIPLLFFISCASKPGTKDLTQKTEMSRTNRVEPEARASFLQAEKLLQQKNYPAALNAYQNIRTKFSRGRANALASYRIGTIYYYQEKYTDASKEFEMILAKYPRSELYFDVTYNLAASEYQLEHYEKAYMVLTRLKMSEVQSQGPKRAEIVFQLAANTASALGNHPSAVASYAAQLLLPLSEGARTNVEENLEGHLEKISDIKILQRLENEISDVPTKNKIAKRIADLGNQGEGAPIASAPVTESKEASVPQIVAIPVSGSTVRTNVGVVLPLTGKLAPYGKKALEGIMLASKVFQSDRSPIKLFIEDSGGNAAQAEVAVEKLIRNNQVIAIVGPLSWKESFAAGQRAAQMGVVNISLTSKEGLSGRSPFLFQNALTPKVQIESLVRYVVGEKGLKRFAIISPQNAFGKDMVDEFWDITEAMGGSIVGYGTYDPDEKDFQSTIRDLTGVDPRFRKIEYAKIQEYIKQMKAKTGREPKTKLKPLIDFDAVFIPDSPKAVGSIAASLAYYDVTNTPLLGTTEWNSPELYKRGGKFVEGAIFPGGISQLTKNPVQKDFIKNYFDAFGTMPDLLASQAYEAMWILSSVIAQRQPDGRSELAEILTSVKDFESPLGTVAFDATRTARRKLPIYQLDGSGRIFEP